MLGVGGSGGGGMCTVLHRSSSSDGASGAVYNTLLDDDADLAVDFAARHRPSLCVSDEMMNNFRTRPTRK